MKGVIRVLLLAFVIVTTAYALGIFREQAPTSEAESDLALKGVPASATPRVIAYYFHTTNRCANCMKFEAWASEALQDHFAEPLGTGTLEWRVINVEEPQNRHFVDDYQLHTKAIVLSKLQDGEQTQWKNLEQIWELLKDKVAFAQYIASETATFLNGGAEG